MNSVGRWLAELGFGQYAEAFASQGIEFDLLADLSDVDLERCGVAMLGHRKRMLKAIAAMREDAAEDVTPRPPAAAALEPRSSGAQKTVAERRQLTVMFCDLVGATALSTKSALIHLRCQTKPANLALPPNCSYWHALAVARGGAPRQGSELPSPCPVPSGDRETAAYPRAPNLCAYCPVAACDGALGSSTQRGSARNVFRAHGIRHRINPPQYLAHTTTRAR